MGTSRLTGKEETAMDSVAPLVARLKGEMDMGSKAPMVAKDKVAVAMEDGVKVQITGF